MGCSDGFGKARRGHPAGWLGLPLALLAGGSGARAQPLDVVDLTPPWASTGAAPTAAADLAPSGRAPGVGRDRDVDCLTSAVYYEAANEPREGQEAVAQVVLNRVRHPAFPKSVCSVVYQGAERRNLGCQFTFTCDGSLDRPPLARQWAQARDVAEAALAGHAATDIGVSTHYHAVYVSPYWRDSLVETRRIGNHVFYRMATADDPAVLSLDHAGAGAGRARTSRKPAAASSSFSVWGVEVARITGRRGVVAVQDPS